VLTGDGVLRLRRLARDGGEPEPAAVLVRSVRATLGLRTADLIRRLRELGADSYFGRASPGSVTGVPLLVNPTLETTGVAPADPVSVSWYCR
jgi:hypothetical protein